MDDYEYEEKLNSLYCALYQAEDENDVEDVRALEKEIEELNNDYNNQVDEKGE